MGGNTPIYPNIFDFPFFLIDNEDEFCWKSTLFTYRNQSPLVFEPQGFRFQTIALWYANGRAVVF